MSDYSFFSRLLHRIALGSNAMGETLFDIELLMSKKKIRPDPYGNHVFVCGLARAGTTVLMRTIFESEQFCSLTYRDMPFPYAPNLWAKVSSRNKRHKDASERAHGDGILVNFDAPEALEEVYWRIFHSDEYISEDKLIHHEVEDDESLEMLQNYIALVLLRYQKVRYLSKNNNNILRVETIRKAFPVANILVPFRHPLHHAQSLLKQHVHFVEQSKKDAFIANYMQWLAHYEFGPRFKPFYPTNVPKISYSPLAVDYWLQQWIIVYRYLIEVVTTMRSPAIFVGYEQLCTSQELGVFLKETIKLEKFDTTNLIERNAQYSHNDFDNMKLLRESLEIYEQLFELCRTQVSG